MAQAKQIKIPGGSAFIEVGQDYVRIGTAGKTFMMVDENSISAGANSVNWQISPNQMTYYGFLTNADPITGFLPISPKYSMSEMPIMAILNMAVTAGLANRVIGF